MGEPNRNQENEQGKRESSGICNQTNSPSKKEQINDKNQDFGAGSNLAAPDGDLITGQNLKIVQAICIACQQLIPNLFDVMDKTLAESELISSVLVHKCENCESPINTDAEFVFPGAVEKQKSIEEVVIVSDEENKTKDVIESICFKDSASNIQRKGKNNRTRAVTSSISICEEEVINEVITLSSSSSTEDEDIIVKPSQTSNRMSRGAKPEPKRNMKLDTKKGKTGNKTDDLIHPKYKLYEMNKLSPIRKAQVKPQNISTIDLRDEDDKDHKMTNVQNMKTFPRISNIEKSEIKSGQFSITDQLDFSVESSLLSSTVKLQTLNNVNDFDEKGISTDIQNLLSNMIKYVEDHTEKDVTIESDMVNIDLNNAKLPSKTAEQKRTLESPKVLFDTVTSQNYPKPNDLKEKHFESEKNRNDFLNNEPTKMPEISNIQGLASFIRNIVSSEQRIKTLPNEDRTEEDSTVPQMGISVDDEQSNVEPHKNDDPENFQNTHWDWVENKEAPEMMAFCQREFKSSPENYLRGCYWSPDGNILLTNSDDNIIRVFNTGDDALNNDLFNEREELSPTFRLSEGETIYDVSWYPFQQSQDPDTCCFLTTSRDHPIHLWDTNTGRIRCSYRAFDQMDEIAAAHSISFNNDGSKIYCGFNNCIRIFDSARPGRQFREQSIVPKKNRQRKGHNQRCLNQRGIVSSIAFSNHSSGLYALGTFSKTVGVYSSNADEPLFLLREHSGGITQLQFTSDGFYLFSGARKDNEVIAWDMRNTSMPLFKTRRHVKTNQRIQFDIDSSCKYLCSGGTDNSVSVWDINDIMTNVGEEVVTHDPLFSFVGHKDAINGVSIHPSCRKMATTSGQRHFFVDDFDSDEQTDGEENAPAKKVKRCFSYDNSMKIWKFK